MQASKKLVTLVVVSALLVMMLPPGFACDIFNEERPEAGFSAEPTSGAVPLDVEFTDQSTGEITNREWDFGDGWTSTEQNPTHTYGTLGQHTVSLTVTGPGGSDTETKTDYINVSTPAYSDGVKCPGQLTSSGRDYVPYISPDGEHIAFLSVRNTYNPFVSLVIFELWIMDKDGSNQHPLISFDDFYDGWITVQRNVSWARDSSHMLVGIMTDGGRGEIWRVNIDGSKTRLSSTDNSAKRPKYSPDGSKIAFTSDPPYDSLYVANSDFSEPVLIEDGYGRIGDFVWGSDSKELIYSFYNFSHTNCELWKYSINGNEKLQFSNTPVSEEDPSYSSDGKYIAYSAQNAIYVTPSATFQPKKVLNDVRGPRWIPNRDLLLITSEQTLDNKSFWTESWVVDLEGEIIMKIGEGHPTSVDFSSNGEYFVYSLDGNLWVDQLLYVDS